MKNIFVYGSLMYSEVWGSIVSKHYDAITANLHGYKRLKVKNEEFPAITEGDGIVQGIVRLNVDNEDIARLDIFESDMYDRVEELVFGPNGKTIKADVYRISDDHRHILEEEIWDKNRFEKEGLKKFIKQYDGFRLIDS